MTDEPYEPKGVRFLDLRSGRDLLLIDKGERHAEWICYRHGEGHWVLLREATEEDLAVVRLLQKHLGLIP